MANKLKNKFACGTRLPTTWDRDKKPLLLNGSVETSDQHSPGFEILPEALSYHPEVHYCFDKFYHPSWC